MAQKSELQEAIDSFRNLRKQDLSKKELFGTAGALIEESTAMDQAGDLVDAVLDAFSSGVLPNSAEDGVLGALKGWNHVASDMMAYRDPSQKEGPRSAVRNYLRSVWRSESPLLPLLGATRFLLDPADLVDQVQRAKSNADELVESLEDRVAELEGVAKTLREASAERSFDKYSDIFYGESLRHSKPFRQPPIKSSADEKKKEQGAQTNESPYSAPDDKKKAKKKLWGFGGAAERYLVFGFLFVGLVMAIVLWWHPSLGGTLSDILPALSQRVIAVSLLAFGAAFCFRQFAINKHLATLNRQRANALSSFDLIMNASSRKEEVKDALLIHLAATIFEAGNTGYLKEGGAADSPAPVQQLVKLIADPGQRSNT